MSPPSPLHTLPLTKEQDAAVRIYSGEILEPLQASRHAVIRHTELMEKSISWSRVAWKGEETCLLHGFTSAATVNHQPTLSRSLALSLYFIYILSISTLIPSYLLNEFKQKHGPLLTYRICDEFFLNHVQRQLELIFLLELSQETPSNERTLNNINVWTVSVTNLRMFVVECLLVNSRINSCLHKKTVAVELFISWHLMLER